MIGGVAGHFLALRVYGAKPVELEPEVESNPELQEALEDQDSLQFAEYTKKRQMKGELDLIRPGKIRD
eukprot:CAMPEP_0170452364 /NCGR_PEP_ID=MMETSP0123-20130129/1287_1 /TAXON_ID=182087 /ORGANISM="Favella ehrenbergii, Strain Fehren 1" /LENGTH=67 /DNA_ID=CAMNT_0010714345 /DNA_START=243 /DNA_END=446 /DNA_ORIENTATION=+